MGGPEVDRTTWKIPTICETFRKRDQRGSVMQENDSYWIGFTNSRRNLIVRWDVPKEGKAFGTDMQQRKGD